MNDSRQNNLFPVKNEVFGINMGEQATLKLFHKDKFCSGVPKTREIDLLQEKLESRRNLVT